MYKNLRSYITRLEEAGELVRVTTPVDPVLEIAEITDRESKRPGGGRALLFEQTGTDFPLLINMMGSDRRVAMALGVETLDELTERIDSLFAALTTPKVGWMDKLKMLPLLEEMSRWLPRQKSGRGACQQVVLEGDAARLGLLPILKCWPHDGGRFITLPLVHTLDPETGTRNVGMYRMQVFSDSTTGMHWHLHKTGERHYRGYQAEGRRMPIAVCLGGDPAYTYAATAPMPDNLDEYLLAGFLRRKPVELVRCLTSDIRVPADCDFVIEGYVDPSEEKVVEGPFGDHTGFYSLEDRYPLFHVTAITHRRDAVYPATIVGVPPQEDLYIAKATEKIFLGPIRAVMLPEVKELYMPAAGVAHNLAVVNIHKSYEGQGAKAASSMWGAGQMMFNKFMVVCATDGDVRNEEHLRQLIRRVRIPEDLLFSRGPLDVLDHAASEMGQGGKLALDLTSVRLDSAVGAECRDGALDEYDPSLPVRLPENIDECCGVVDADDTLGDWGALLLFAERGKEVDAPEWLRRNPVRGAKCVVLLDNAASNGTGEEWLWLMMSNCDPARDILVQGGVLFVDARSKAGGVNGFTRPWPNIVASSAETIELVDSRWAEYGLGEFEPSPSLKYRPWQQSDSAEVVEGD